MRGSACALAVILAVSCGVHTNQGGGVEITSINPTAGSLTGGIAVIIDGSGLDDGTGHANVLFGTNPATVTSVTASAIHVTLPAGSACGGVDVQVSNSHGSAVKPAGFAYSGGTGSLTVTSITPGQGGIAGGTPVTIAGSGFTGGVGVSLGGVGMENIQVVSDTQITAVAAVATSGGQVDLVLRNCTTQASLPKSWIYVTGLNGAVIDHNRTEYLNGNQYAAPTPQNYSDPYVAFIQPSTETLINPLPVAGSCTYSTPTPAPTPVPVTILDAGTTVDLSTGANQTILTRQTGGDYYFPYDAMGNLTSQHFNAAAGFVKGATYDFDATGGAIPAFTLTGAYTAPADYTVTAPNIAATTPTTITRNAALAFTWTGGAAASVFEIELIGIKSGGLASGERLQCVAATDGAAGNYTIAATDMSRFTATTIELIVITNRRKDTPFIVPSNGSTATALASLVKVGALLMP